MGAALAAYGQQHDLEIPLLEFGGRGAPQALDGVAISLMPRTWLDVLRPHFAHLGLVAAVFALATVALAYEDPGARMWVVIGLLSYVASQSWGSVVHLVDILTGQLYLEVSVESHKSSALFHSLTELVITSGAVDGCGAVSRDCEGQLQTDYVSGQKTVQFGFWGRRSRGESVSFVDARGQRRCVRLNYQRGTDLICGREALPTPQQSLTLRMRSTAADLRGDHAALLAFCQEAYSRHMRPENGVVDIFFPYESSTEWAPEWKRERSIKIAPEPTASGIVPASVGLRYDLQREAFREILNDAELWCRDKLRVYVVHGPPGVGKSHFVGRLAHATGLPIYRARLTSLSLRDDSLQQLFSANVMLHDSVLVHFDEFQGVLENWKAGGGGCKVTPEGFDEFLQGSSSMQKGIVVLTGSRELGLAAKDFPSLFRRAACVCQVNPLSGPEAAHYFQAFLQAFVSLPDDAWARWGDAFAQCDIGERIWSIDALQQYLMRQIAAARNSGMIERRAGDRSSTDWRMRDGHVDAVLGAIVDPARCVEFLDGYAVKY